MNGTLRIGEAIASVEKIWAEDGKIKVRAHFRPEDRYEAGPVVFYDYQGNQVAAGQRVDLMSLVGDHSFAGVTWLTVTWEMTVDTVNNMKMVRSKHV